MTDIDLKQMLFEQKMKDIEDDVVPFGFVDDGSNFIQSLEDEKPEWVVELPDNGWTR